MFDARAVLGIVLYFKEKVLKPLRKDGYLNRCNLPKKDTKAFWFGCLSCCLQPDCILIYEVSGDTIRITFTYIGD